MTFGGLKQSSASPVFMYESGGGGVGGGGGGWRGRGVAGRLHLRGIIALA